MAAKPELAGRDCLRANAPAVISPWKLRRVVQAVTPPILLAGLLRARDRIPGLAPEWRACFEYVPEGWARLRSEPGIAGWNVEAVRVAYERKVGDFVDALDGAGPLTVSTSPSRAASVEGSSYDHNLNLTYAYSLALAAQDRASVSVLDWGGGVGLSAFLARAVLPGVTIDYHCKDVPIVCESGRRLFPDLTFHEDDRCLERQYDLVLASSSLEYSENWTSVLAGLAGVTGRYLYLARMPVCFEHPSFVVLQRLHMLGVRTEALGWVFNRGELLAAAEAAGMTLRREFLTGLRVPAHRAPEARHGRGYLFSPARQCSTISSPVQCSEGLELTPAARKPLEPETAAELYPLVSEVREALGRLVEALDRVCERAER